jgi:hypothetical protein
MKKVIAKKDFTTNIGEYIAGDEITGLTYEQIVKLNEKGFIEPLNYKDLVLIKRELDNPKKETKIKEERL